jgi:hypothetical protein
MITGLLTVLHVLGIALGAGGAFFAEVFYIRAIRDGVIDPTEGDFLKTTYRMLRIGTFILVFTGFAFFVVYRLDGNVERLYTAKYWAKETLVIIILLNAIFLQTKRIPFWLGSAISLTSWTAAIVIGAWRRIPGTYLELMLYYAVAVPIVAGVLEFIRKKMTTRI